MCKDMFKEAFAGDVLYYITPILTIAEYDVVEDDDPLAQKFISVGNAFWTVDEAKQAVSRLKRQDGHFLFFEDENTPIKAAVHVCASSLGHACHLYKEHWSHVAPYAIATCGDYVEGNVRTEKLFEFVDECMNDGYVHFKDYGNEEEF